MEIGGKDSLCINCSINYGKTNIAEKCQYLLEHSHCPFYHQMGIKDIFGRTALEAVTLGTKHRLCPYYAMRNVVACSDILCVPYISLLNEEVRAKSGISLSNSIVILD